MFYGKSRCKKDSPGNNLPEGKFFLPAFFPTFSAAAVAVSMGVGVCVGVVVSVGVLLSVGMVVSVGAAASTATGFFAVCG